MPGSQELLLLGRLGKYDLSMKVRPESRWQHVKLIGPLMLFRLSANIRFRVDIETTNIGPDAPPWTDFPNMQWSERLVFFLNSEPCTTNRLKFEVPSSVGGKVSLTTDTYFLQVIGDAELRLNSGAGPGYGCYSFRVWEPVLSVVNWTMALVAGGVGALIVWAIGALAGGDPTPPFLSTGGSPQPTPEPGKSVWTA